MSLLTLLNAPMLAAYTAAGWWGSEAIYQIAARNARSSPDEFAVRDRLLVFGGWNGRAMVNDTWSLTFRGTPRWQEERPRGVLPEARARHSAIYDPRSRRSRRRWRRKRTPSITS